MLDAIEWTMTFLRTDLGLRHQVDYSYTHKNSRTVFMVPAKHKEEVEKAVRYNFGTVAVDNKQVVVIASPI